MGIAGQIGQPMGACGLGHIGTDHTVRARCHRDRRPTMTGHGPGHYSLTGQDISELTVRYGPGASVTRIEGRP